MHTSTFHHHLTAHPAATLVFVLPSGAEIPAHAHITEVGRVEKRFLDCGGTVRRTVTTNLQAWVDADTEHRFLAGKLAAVLDRAAPLFTGPDEDPAVEIEYEADVLSQYPVETAAFTEGRLVFHLGAKHTDCLARDICLPPSPTVDSCAGTTGCC